jgi:SP family myo-inositol transporter-like MFS transporter 13
LPFLEGLSVDEAFTLFNDGFGVKKSKDMRREKTEMQKTYNAEGLPAGLTDLVDKGEASHKENVDPTKSIGIKSSE